MLSAVGVVTGVTSEIIGAVKSPVLKDQLWLEPKVFPFRSVIPVVTVAVKVEFSGRLGQLRSQRRCSIFVLIPVVTDAHPPRG